MDGKVLAVDEDETAVQFPQLVDLPKVDAPKDEPLNIVYHTYRLAKWKDERVELVFVWEPDAERILEEGSLTGTIEVAEVLAEESSRKLTARGT